MKITKALATITAPEIADAPNGGFTAVLSTPARDRDGDQLYRDEWIEPLPDHITLDLDHQMSVAGTIGSARPYFDDDGRLMIDAQFASTPQAQEARSLVLEGHVRTVSVAFLNDKSQKDGKARRELLNAGLVSVPSNREAVILSSKAFDAISEYKAAKSDGKDSEKPYGDVAYGDPGYLDSEGKPAKDGNGQHRYPLDSESHVRSAWSYINQEKNADQYTAAQLNEIKDKIKAAAKKYGIEIDDDKQKAFDRVTALTDRGLTFDEVCKALDVEDADRDEFVSSWTTSVRFTDAKGTSGTATLTRAPSGGVSTLPALAQTKAGARNSANDSKMIQAIHDAASLLGADCVSEAAPDVEDGASEGANKAVRQSFVVGKAMTGSMEDMNCRLSEALCDACGSRGYGGAYPYIRATYLNPDGQGGSVVYDLGGETLCRAFADDGSCVTLDSVIQVVTVITTVAPVPDTVDGDPVMLPPAAAEASKAVAAETITAGAVTATLIPQVGMDYKEFVSALEAIPGIDQLTVTTHKPTSIVVDVKSSEPVGSGSPESPAAEDLSASPDSKAAPKGPAEDESADEETNPDAAEDDEKEDDEDEKMKVLRARLLIANAQLAS